MKHLIITLLGLIVFIYLPAQDNRLEIIQKDIQDVENIRKATKDLHNSLMDVKGQVDELAAKARNHQLNNMSKVYIKGLWDVFELLLSPASSAEDILEAGIMNYVVQPYLMKARTDTVDLERLKIRQTTYTTELNSKYQNIETVMRADLEEFDDDNPPFAYAKDFWRDPDGRPDDETELLTRKLSVIAGLCDDLSIQINACCMVLREDFISWNRIIDQDKNLLPRLKKEAEIDQQIRERHQERMKEFQEAEEIAEKLRKEEEAYNALTENEKYALHQKKQALKQKQQEYEDLSADEDMAKSLRVGIAKSLMEALELGKTASISYEVMSEPILGKNSYAKLKVYIDPEGAAGDLIFEVDDFVVLLGGFAGDIAESEYLIDFKNTGIHDVSVSLFVNGVFIDKHLQQITVEEDPKRKASYEESLIRNNLALIPTKRLPSIPDRDGRTLIVDLPFSKYWASGLKGQEIIDGHYFNMSGQKKEYKSKKIMDFNPADPIYGFFALTSFNGYHVYRTMENDIPCLIITLLAANGPEEKENISNVSEFEVIISQNYSKADIKYKTAQGVAKIIELK